MIKIIHITFLMVPPLTQVVHNTIITGTLNTGGAVGDIYHGVAQNAHTNEFVAIEEVVITKDQLMVVFAEPFSNGGERTYTFDKQYENSYWYSSNPVALEKRKGWEIKCHITSIILDDKFDMARIPVEVAGLRTILSTKFHEVPLDVNPNADYAKHADKMEEALTLIRRKLYPTINDMYMAKITQAQFRKLAIEKCNISEQISVYIVELLIDYRYQFPQEHY